MESRANGAELSARFEKSSEGLQLVITNLGASHANLIAVQVLGELITLDGRPDLEDIHLSKDEMYLMKASVSRPTPATVRVLMVWVDARGTQSREQILSL